MIRIRGRGRVLIGTMTADVISLPSRRAPWVSVIAFDPGVTCGWAWLAFDESLVSSLGITGSISSAGDRLFRMGQIDVGLSSYEETAGALTMTQYVQRSVEVTREAANRAYQYEPDGRSHPARLPVVRSCVICEGFSLQEATKDRTLLSPVRLQAKLEQALVMTGVEHEWFNPLPSEKGVATDERLLRWGLARKGHLKCDCHRHSNDALRHLIVWMRTQYGLG